MVVVVDSGLWLDYDRNDQSCDEMRALFKGHVTAPVTSLLCGETDSTTPRPCLEIQAFRMKLKFL